jgi:hypothetical protein
VAEHPDGTSPFEVSLPVMNETGDPLDETIDFTIYLPSEWTVSATETSAEAYDGDYQVVMASARYATFADSDSLYSDAVVVRDIDSGLYKCKYYHMQPENTSGDTTILNELIYCIAVGDRMMFFTFYPSYGTGIGTQSEQFTAYINTLELTSESSIGASSSQDNVASNTVTEEEKEQLLNHGEILTGDLIRSVSVTAEQGLESLDKLAINNLIFLSSHHIDNNEYLYHDVAKEAELYEFSAEKVERMAYEVFGESDWVLEGGDTLLNEQTQSYETTLGFGIGGPFSYEDMTVRLSGDSTTLSASFILTPSMIAEGDEGWEEYGRYHIEYKILRENERLFLRFDSFSAV